MADVTEHLLEEIRDVFAAAFGPGPGAGVVVEGRGHDVVLMLDSRLAALRTVVMRHVEPETHTAYTSRYEHMRNKQVLQLYRGKMMIIW